MRTHKHIHSCMHICVRVHVYVCVCEYAGVYRGQKRVSDVPEIDSCEHPDVGAWNWTQQLSHLSIPVDNVPFNYLNVNV